MYGSGLPNARCSMDLQRWATTTTSRASGGYLVVSREHGGRKPVLLKFKDQDWKSFNPEKSQDFPRISALNLRKSRVFPMICHNYFGNFENIFPKCDKLDCSSSWGKTGYASLGRGRDITRKYTLSLMLC